MTLERKAVDSGERGEYETRPASLRLASARFALNRDNLAKICGEPVIYHSHNASKPFSLDELGSETRFWSKVNKTETCWLWTASTDRNGYGRFRVGNRTLVAHVVGYALAGCQLPEGQLLDHLCRTRSCVRADHLEPVTHLENVRRSPDVARTDEERRAAKSERNRRYRAKRKVAA